MGEGVVVAVAATVGVSDGAGMAARVGVCDDTAVADGSGVFEASRARVAVAAGATVGSVVNAASCAGVGEDAPHPAKASTSRIPLNRA
jgi:hypothetical protein